MNQTYRPVTLAAMRKQVPTKNRFLFRLDQLGIERTRVENMFVQIQERIIRMYQGKKVPHYEVVHHVAIARDALLVAAMNNPHPVNWKLFAMEVARIK